MSLVFGTSPYGVQWMRVEPDAPFPEIVAFDVDDLAAALTGKDVLIVPNSPSNGVTIAMTLSDAPRSSLWNSSPRNGQDVWWRGRRFHLQSRQGFDRN
jgi:hypothetical protein